MGRKEGDVGHRPLHTEIELAPLVGAGGKMEILIREQHQKAIPLDHAAAAPEPWPWFVIPVLVTAVVAVSSAGVAFALVTDVPALRLGAWRLSITTAVCSPICAWQYIRLAPELKQRTLRSVWKLLFSGLCLSIHFSTWVWGLKHTSLVHAYLMVSVTPLAIAVGALIMRKPISAGEVAGTVLGVAGAAVLALGPKTGRAGSDATLVGDAVTLIGAISIIGYLEVGQSLRSFMPLMVYAVPVTGIAGLSMALGSFAFEHARIWPLGTQSIVGFLDGTDILPVLWLGLVPGILGHQGLNTALKYISPLALSLSTACEPLIGSAMGYLLGLTAAPSMYMYAGGTLIMSATVLVTLAAHRRKARDSGSVKRQLSFSDLPTTDDEDEEALMPAKSAHERAHAAAGG